jgi:3-methyladenine DNA glycosylase AlkD
VPPAKKTRKSSMPAARNTSKGPSRRARAAPAGPGLSITDKVAFALATLASLGTPRVRDDMARRFGITGKTASTAHGVPMNQIQKLAKELRLATPKARKPAKTATKAKKPEPPAAGAPDAAAHNHALAQALWDTGKYDARMVAVYVAEPSLVTPAQMDAWTAGMDNWAICDTACFHLFDKTPHALDKIDQWSTGRLSRGVKPPADDEFVRRTAFALFASVALHDKGDIEDRLLALLPLTERAVTNPPDDRNFVIKAVSWALRSAARRPRLRTECVAIARRLADLPHAGARWTGKDVLRQLKAR